MTDAWVPAAAPPSPPPPASGRSRLPWIAAAGVLVAVALVLAVRARDDGDGTPTTAPAPVDQARVLNDLIAAGRDATAHVTYSVVDPAQTGASTTVETWRAPPRYRYDQVVQSATGARRDIQVDDGRELVRCVETGGRTTCPDRAALDAPRTPEVAALVPADLARTFIYSVTKAATPPPIEATTDEIVGLEASCFSASGVGELCLGLDGVVLRLVLGDLRVEATAVDADVPAATFDPR